MPPFICHTLILARVRSSPRNSLCCFNSLMFFLGLVRALTHTAWSTPRVYPRLPKKFKRHPSSAHTPLCAPGPSPGQAGGRMLAGSSSTGAALAALMDGRGRCPPVQLLQTGCSSLASQEACQMEKPSRQQSCKLCFSENSRL